MENMYKTRTKQKRKVAEPQKDSLAIFKCDKGLEKSDCAFPMAGATTSILAPLSASCSPSQFCTIAPDTLLMKL